MQSDKNYFLREDVRIYFNADFEIRFRKGIWNYVEAVLNLQQQDPAVKKVVGDMVKSLQIQGHCSTKEVQQNASLSEVSKFEVLGTFERIQMQGFLVSEKENKLNSLFTNILGNQLDGLNLSAENMKPVLFFSDNKIAKDAFQALAKQINLPVEIMDDSLFNEIYQAEITSRIDPLQTESDIKRFTEKLAKYSCITGNFGTLNITFLRNLNRILVAMEKGLIFSYLDGPFLGCASLFPPETGCFECLENRILGRLEDTVAYHKFIKEPVRSATDTFYEVNSPWIHFLNSLLVSESFLQSVSGISKFRGRILNIYLPVFEIQVQDLLRVPYCASCGHSSKARVQELYTSSKNLVDNLLARVGSSN